MIRAALALAVLAASGVAAADPAPVCDAPAGSAGKLAWLAEKAAKPARDPAARTAFEAELARRKTAPAPVPLTIRNVHTMEALVVALPPPPPLPKHTRPSRKPQLPPPGPLPAPPLPQPVVNQFMRCHFTNAATDEDARLLPVVVLAASRFQATYAEVVSGYRAPKYNLMLRKKGHEVSNDSQHSHGNAVDFRLQGVTTRDLREWVASLKLGGVGYYPVSEFVHADVGPVRYWTAH